MRLSLIIIFSITNKFTTEEKEHNMLAFPSNRMNTYTTQWYYGPIIHIIGDNWLAFRDNQNQDNVWQLWFESHFLFGLLLPGIFLLKFWKKVSPIDTYCKSCISMIKSVVNTKVLYSTIRNDKNFDEWQ